MLHVNMYVHIIYESRHLYLMMWGLLGWFRHEKGKVLLVPPDSHAYIFDIAKHESIDKRKRKSSEYKQFL